MLDPGFVEEIRRLLAAGRWSMRRIARELRVSRGTVHAIAHGRRRERRPPPTEDDPAVEPSGPLVRCPGCGGLVVAPCRLCRVRRKHSGSCRGKLAGVPEGPLELDLAGEHRARYERIRARRIRRGWDPEEH